jgi:alkanesulfonate monooxygenase SsuD/methylene tetrahydromethanopterin reductase-like flavin-dependent oxidoreductase (luciferase family)
MLKPITVVYPVMPTKDEAERAALRPIGRNRDLYHQAIHGWTDVVRAADEMGVWGVGGIEHHFWSEGYEVGLSPGTLDAYWAAITKNIHVGTLGYVMSTQNPIRVAEETAIVNHLARGRSFVGFALGYQSR